MANTTIPRAQSLIEKFWARVQKTESCWLWTGTILHTGYGTLQVGAHPKHHSAHRLSYEIHFGQIPNGLRICHRCDVKKCVNPEHLFAGTAKDNSQDMVNKGRSCAGSKNAMTKLNESQVREIRRRYSNGGITQRQLAEEFSLGQATVANIINHRRWSHLHD